MICIHIKLSLPIHIKQYNFVYYYSGVGPTPFNMNINNRSFFYSPTYIYHSMSLHLSLYFELSVDS